MSQDMIYEDVPRLLRRTGDNLIAGANNATILLGRDRLGSVDSGYGALGSSNRGAGAGAIHMIVGRSAEDPSIADDKATLYMSALSDPDTAAGTSEVGTQNTTRKSAIVGRADCIRISSRVDFKLSVGQAYITMDASGAIVIEGDISLGEGASQRLMRGDAFSAFWSTVIVATPSGPASPLPPIPDSVFGSRSKIP